MSIQEQIDRLFLRAAVKLAERGLATVTTNNPRVGCLLVRNGHVIGRGAHLKDGGPHAEVAALNSSAESVREATAYVTLEPCCLRGRTGSCAEALLEAGISRVVVAELDPHPEVEGKGLEMLRKAGIECELIPVDEVNALNLGRRLRFQKHRPFVRIKSAISIDGRTALASGESKWITNELSRRDVQGWRARSSAILSGSGTVLSDDPSLSVRDPRFPGSCPTRVIFDTRCRIPASARVFNIPGRTILVCGNACSRPAFLPADDVWQQRGENIEIGEVLHRLAQEGANEVLVEAGARLAGAFAEAQLWDEWIVYVAPSFMGSSAKPMLHHELERMRNMIKGKIASVVSIGNDLRIVLEPAHA